MKVRRVDDRHYAHPFWRERHGWLEDCPWRCGEQYWVPDGARLEPDRWDGHLAVCPNQPRALPIYSYTSDVPVRWITLPRGTPVRKQPDVLCACGDLDVQHADWGCRRRDCLCLSPAAVVREVYGS